MLDGAYEAGKERKEEQEQDVPEEDNGIEMSEDFDSHLQVRVYFCCFKLRYLYLVLIVTCRQDPVSVSNSASLC
jgi:hypothetical protein